MSLDHQTHLATWLTRGQTAANECHDIHDPLQTMGRAWITIGGSSTHAAPCHDDIHAWTLRLNMMKTDKLTLDANKARKNPRRAKGHCDETLKKG